MDLAEFNRAPASAAAQTARVWADVPRWVEEIVAHRPYGSVDELADVAGDAAATWGAEDLDAALVHHPRIGERPGGSGAEAAASRTEQAAVAGADPAVTAAIAQANVDYEQRFGRVFLIRAAARSPEEMLAEVRRRLALDEATETAEALAQLREIAILRLRTALEPPRET